MIEFTIEKCKTKAAYSAKPKSRVSLDLKKVTKKFCCMLDTPVVVMVKIEGVAVIVHQHGELLFKECSDVALMEKIAARIYESCVEKLK